MRGGDQNQCTYMEEQSAAENHGVELAPRTEASEHTATTSTLPGQGNVFLKVTWTNAPQERQQGSKEVAQRSDGHGW